MESLEGWQTTMSEPPEGVEADSKLQRVISALREALADYPSEAIDRDLSGKSRIELRELQREVRIRQLQLRLMNKCIAQKLGRRKRNAV
jgi:hypothetical protein